MFGFTRLVRQAMRRDLAEVEAGHVEHVDAEVGDDEPLLGREVGLLGVDVVAGAEGDPAEMRRADQALADQLAAAARSGGWKRKFSCTISGTPRRGAGRDHGLAIGQGRARTASARSSARAAARRARPAAGARPPWSRCRRSRASARAAWWPHRCSAAAPERPAALSALAGSRSQTATSSTSAIEAQALRWFSAKKPQPITVPRKRWLMFPPRGSCACSSRSRMPVRIEVDQDRDEDDRADDQRIDVRVGVGHHQAVLDGLDQHGAEHGADAPRRGRRTGRCRPAPRRRSPGTPSGSRRSRRRPPPGSPRPARRCRRSTPQMQ